MKYTLVNPIIPFNKELSKAVKETTPLLAAKKIYVTLARYFKNTQKNAYFTIQEVSKTDKTPVYHTFKVTEKKGKNGKIKVDLEVMTSKIDYSKIAKMIAKAKAGGQDSDASGSDSSDSDDDDEQEGGQHGGGCGEDTIDYVVKQVNAGDLGGGRHNDLSLTENQIDSVVKGLEGGQHGGGKYDDVDEIMDLIDNDEDVVIRKKLNNRRQYNRLYDSIYMPSRYYYEYWYVPIYGEPIYTLPVTTKNIAFKYFIITN